MSVTGKRFVLSAAVALCFFIAAGCGGDDPTVPENDPIDLTGDWPTPPQPAAPTDQVPNISTSSIHAVGMLDNFWATTAPDEEFGLEVILDALESSQAVCADTSVFHFVKCDPDVSVQVMKDGEALEYDWPFQDYIGPYFNRNLFELIGEHEGHYYYQSLLRHHYHFALTNAVFAPNAGLVNIGSQAENDFINNLLDCEEGPYIIGGQRCSTAAEFAWVQYWGEDHQWDNFVENEPDMSDHFTLMGYGGDCSGSWVGRDKTTDEYFYIVEATEPLPSDQCISYRRLQCPGCYAPETLFLWPNQTRITSEPYLARELFWIKIGEAILTSENQEFRQTFQYTTGSSQSQTESLAVMIGASTTVEAGGSYGPFSASVSGTLYGEVTGSLSQTVEFYTESTQSREFASGGPREDGTRVVVVWQKAERYFIADGEGDPWDEPPFTAEPLPILVHRLESFLIDATDF